MILCAAVVLTHLEIVVRDGRIWWKLSNPMCDFSPEIPLKSLSCDAHNNPPPQSICSTTVSTACGNRLARVPTYILVKLGKGCSLLGNCFCHRLLHFMACLEHSQCVLVKSLEPIGQLRLCAPDIGFSHSSSFVGCPSAFLVPVCRVTVSPLSPRCWVVLLSVLRAKL